MEVKALNKDVMQAVESLNYRVTVGDVAAKAGLNLEVAQQGLLVLATEAQGHMQVSEQGEIAYTFPRNFRSVLRNKHWQLQAQELLSKIWEVVFYLIRVSFGIVLLTSIVLIFIAIFALMIVASSQGGGGDRDDRRGGGFVFFPTNIWYLFDFDYRRGRQRYPNRYSGRYSGQGATSKTGSQKGELNFLEAIFSFLFGDGDPNADLEDRRWQAIGAVIANNEGVIAAEQVAPYLDDLGNRSAQEDEDYMLPVLARFNGYPQVSPQGELVYYFPELQTSALARGKAAVSAYLKEAKRKFTSATSDQVMLSIGLGAVNIIAALVLGNMLQNAVAQGIILTGFLGFMQAILGILMGYGIAFLVVPLIRYYWMQGQNAKIEQRNEMRSQRAIALNRLGSALQEKLAFAKQFATRKVLKEEDFVYSTENELLAQEIEGKAKLGEQEQLPEQGTESQPQLEDDFLRRLNEI